MRKIPSLSWGEIIDKAREKVHQGPRGGKQGRRDDLALKNKGQIPLRWEPRKRRKCRPLTRLQARRSAEKFR